MTSQQHQRRRVPAIVRDARRNPFFALGAFGLSGWAYIGMSHTIADYEGEALGYALGVAYEALVIGLAWEGRRRADQALDAGRKIHGHGKWLGGAIVVGILSGALAAWHGWTLGEGIFAVSRAVAPILAAVCVHLFFQSAASARDIERREQIREDQESAVLDMLDAVRLAKIAPEHERAEHIAAVNAAVTNVHRNVPAAVTADVTAPHLESERTIRNVIRDAADLAGEWMPEPEPQLLLPAGVRVAPDDDDPESVISPGDERVKVSAAMTAAPSSRAGVRARSCQAPGCTNDISHRRANARTCSPTCRNKLAATKKTGSVPVPTPQEV